MTSTLAAALAGDGKRTAPPIGEDILAHIGCTPLVRLNRIPQSLGVKATVYVKCEFFNAGGSVKDRIAKRMVLEAEKSGRIKPGDTLIEPTSGNTGIGLALVGAVRGYRTIITLPEKMSAEKVAVLRALGAEIVRTPTEAAWDAPESHIGVAKRLQQEIPNSHILDQYCNVDNPLAHEYGTAEEIWEQTGGKVDMLVAGAGTGGTVTGIARGLRKHHPGIKIIAADPHGSVLALPEDLNKSTEGYKVEGIGYDFIPDVLDRELIDKWYKTGDKESFAFARRLIKEEGLLVGGSSGSAMAAAMQEAKGLKEGDVVVVVLPDSIRSYLSKFADDDWMVNNDFMTADELEKPDASKSPYQDATIRSLRLKNIVTIQANAKVSSAIEIMREKAFDQLPVLSDTRLVGLVTLGNLLSYMSRGKIHASSPVEETMFDFRKITEVVTDPNEIGAVKKVGDKAEAKPRRNFDQITLDTPLSALTRFFEHNSAAIVTEERAEGGLKPIHIVTKVDLLGYLVRQEKK
ncbi:cystathionine beta-synthase [Drechslerella stenobrocha 248]|uniref:Cystathionine beta-synthase n=1 Tax=Drechslerella stenobrocha 248 TaxID=1043628 RepID=W7IDG8_9PEZI|nr:cystathionine beta-synthase [Drechslerella stenobrocha 248]